MPLVLGVARHAVDLVDARVRGRPIGVDRERFAIRRERSLQLAAEVEKSSARNALSPASDNCWYFAQSSAAHTSAFSCFSSSVNVKRPASRSPDWALSAAASSGVSTGFAGTSGFG